MRQKRLLSIVLVLLISFSFPASIYAKEKNYQIKNYQTVRIDTRRDEDHTYLTRIEFSLFHALSDEFDVTLELKPFAETRYLWDREEWNQTESGLETGFHLTEWAYIGESFQYTWFDEGEDSPELKTILAMYIPIMLKSNGYKITLELLEEYTYTFEEGKATNNEIAANFIFPVFKQLELLCGWRHIDWIHDYDSDQVELSAIFVF